MSHPILTDATNRLDDALYSDDGDAIERAAREGQAIVINFNVDGNINGDLALQRTLDDFERRIADALRSR